MRVPIREMADGFYFTLAGKEHGPWVCRAYAEAGLAVELQRELRRERERELAKAMGRVPKVELGRG